MELLITTNTGCEKWLEDELRELGFRPLQRLQSKVLILGKTDDIIRLNFLLRQAHRVYMLLYRGSVSNLQEIRRITSSLDYSDYIGRGQTFAVRGSREGKHEFTSIKMAAEVGAGITESYRSTTGTIPKVDLEDPDVEFHAVLENNDFMLLLNTTGASLHKRYPKPYLHHAPLKTTLAATMLRLSSFKKRGSLLDPMAGGGTIPIEASLICRDIPAGYFRTNYAFRKMIFINDDGLLRLRDRVEKRICDAIITGADKYQRNVEGMRRNMNALNVSFNVVKGDATKLDYIKAAEYPLIITNPPYGLRIASKKAIRYLYKGFVQAMRDKDVEEIVAITAEYALLSKLLSEVGFEIVLSKTVIYGDLKTKMLKGLR